MSADGSNQIRLPLTGKTIRAADLFCGAGGTSTGALRAIRELGGKMKLTGVNHWPVAIETHTRNHPDAEHLCADLERVRPREVVPEGVLDLLMASPTCTYYSRARGGRPVHDQQRMDPWHVVRWCTELRVHRLLVENVPEMMDWGPCDIRTGRPIPSRKGEYFRAWIEALKGIGMRVDYRVLVCADYGDPTTRERFFLIGRSDKRALRWPEPPHAKGGKVDLLGTRAPWHAAREIIDWNIAGKSIFSRKRPLKPNTIRRILAGAKRYGWPAPHIAALQALLDGREPILDMQATEAAPFLIQFRGTEAGQLQASERSVSEPDGALTAGGGHQALVMATGASGAARMVDQPIPSITTTATPHFIEPLLMGVGSSNAAKPTTEPAPTITMGGGSAEKRPGNARPQLIEPIIVHRTNSEGGRNARTLDEPAPTVATRGAGYLAEPLLAPYYGSGSGQTSQPTSEPVPGITTKARFGVAEAVLLRGGHGNDGHTDAGRVVDPAAPLPTVTGSNEIGVAQAVILPTTHQGDARVRSEGDPLPTVTGANRGELGVSQPVIVQTSYSGVRVPVGTEEPLRTITAAKGGDMAVAAPIVMRAGHGGDALKNPGAHVLKPDAPLPAQTGGNEFGIAEAIVMRGNVGEGRTGDMRSAAEPMPTVTCSESLAVSAPFLVPNFGEAPGQEPRTHSIDAPTPAITATGHIQLAEPAATGYRIDILYRMLHWRELSRAMSFDDEGEVYDFAGTATDITKQIGNAVPCRTAKALVRALMGGA